MSLSDVVTVSDFVFTSARAPLWIQQTFSPNKRSKNDLRQQHQLSLTHDSSHAWSNRVCANLMPFSSTQSSFKGLSFSWEFLARYPAYSTTGSCSVRQTNMRLRSQEKIEEGELDERWRKRVGRVLQSNAVGVKEFSTVRLQFQYVKEFMRLKHYPWGEYKIYIYR